MGSSQLDPERNPGERANNAFPRRDLELAPVNGPDDLMVLMADSADMITVATSEGKYRYVSPASRTLFLWDPVDLKGRHQEEFIHPDDAEAMRDAEKSSLLIDSTFTTTYRFRCGNGQYSWVEATFHRVEANGEVLIVGSIRDVETRKETDVQLQRQAWTDPLTGIANRSVLMDRLHHALARLDRSSGILAVFFLDLDRFKVINDSLGHRIGDVVLKTIAERLLRFIRSTDTLGRLGGDEFVLIAEEMADEQTAVELGNRITESCREPFKVGEEEFVCTASIGIATTADSHQSGENLLQEADLALYRAKDRGRDRAEVFDEELRTTAVGRLAIERMLRRAIDESRLRLHYQPIVELSSNRVVSVEALVRIFDRELGLIEPVSFLTVAEETGLLFGIDEWVFTEALRETAGWRARLSQNGSPRVGLNVTSRRVADATFCEATVNALDSNGLARDSLEIEVTERVLMEASNSAMTGLRALRDAGIKVGLDDFGTGFSSLAYLRQFPLDFLKIDMSFIHGLAPGNSEEAIVEAIIGLSHAIDLQVVAEGVETQEQLDSLVRLGCDRAQGFLFARPGEPALVEDLVMTGGNSPHLNLNGS